MPRLLALARLFCAVAGIALATPALSGAQEVSPGDSIEVFLLTAGPGDDIWERFSHNAIRIRDARDGSDLAYNWGIFDFRQESFIKNLARGRMLYAMYGIPMEAMQASYIRADRQLVQHPIRLTPEERLELQRILRAMDTDANRDYIYNYYTDNCSTRVRDALDRVLGGVIEERWDSVPTETTYRWHTRRLTWPVAWAYFGIQFVVGNPGDEPISAHGEMFLPLRLMDYLEQTEVTGPDGSVHPLLGEPVVLHASARPPVPTAPPNLLALFLGVGVVLAGGLVVLGKRAATGSAGSRWTFSLAAALPLATFGLLGTGLLLSWLFTDHQYWTWNENAFSMNPLGLVLAAALLMGAASARWGMATKVSLGLAALSGLGLVLQPLPGFDQVNGEIAALVVPLNLAVAWSCARLSNTGQST